MFLPTPNILVCFGLTANVVTFFFLTPILTWLAVLQRKRCQDLICCQLLHTAAYHKANTLSWQAHSQTDTVVKSFHTDIIRCQKDLYHHAQGHIDAMCIIPQSLLVGT